MSNPITPNGPNIPAQSPEAQGWVAWVKEGIGTAISRTKTSAMYVLAASTAMAMPDRMSNNDNLAAMPNGALVAPQEPGKQPKTPNVRPADPEAVKEKHRENIQAAKDLSATSPQSYFDTLQKADPLLIPEELVPDIVICCMDGRHGSGKNFPIAGAGLLLQKEQLEVMARNTVDLAKRKYERLKKTITIRVRPHLQGQCGAAALARKLRGEKDLSPKAVDEEAMAGAERTAKRIRELAEGVVPVNVVVEPFDPNNFYNDPDHPELGMLVNGTDMVINGDRKKGPMLFNVSTKLAGEQVATDDAVLAGVIALLSHHGMHDSKQGLPKDTPFRIIFAGTREDTDRLKKKAEGTLRSHKELAAYYMKKGIIVETWVPQQEKKEEKKHSWLDPLRERINPQVLPNRQTSRAQASEARRRGKDGVAA